MVLLTDLGLPVLALVVLRGELVVLGLHELELLLVDVALDGLLDLVAALALANSAAFLNWPSRFSDLASSSPSGLVLLGVAVCAFFNSAQGRTRFCMFCLVLSWCPDLKSEIGFVLN